MVVLEQLLGFSALFPQKDCYFLPALASVPVSYHSCFLLSLNSFLVLAVVRSYFLLNFGASALCVLKQGLSLCSRAGFSLPSLFVCLLMLTAFPLPTAGSTLSTMDDNTSGPSAQLNCLSVAEPPQCSVPCFKAKSCSGSAELYPVAMGITLG